MRQIVIFIFMFFHMRPLFVSQEDGIEPTTYNVRASGLNHCSKRALPFLVSVFLFSSRNTAYSSVSIVETGRRKLDVIASLAIILCFKFFTTVCRSSLSSESLF